MRTLIVAALLAGLLAPLQALAQATPAAAPASSKDVTLYKNPQCTCCEDYATYLRQNGFKVKVVYTQDLSLISKERGVPTSLEGCHLSMIDGYVVEGHVTVDLIHRLLRERPKITGISLPGMPMGTPGMDGPKSGPLTVYQIAPGAPAFGTQ
ncbi:MAG: DUF411 domain-containing protein [Proteobacteria bacterium]|nr:DUF411 domain-containing protein [Pseudomonadota bacterium]MBI3498576.1 DUF411 domain-containing protein [Pseudomonadota bacterium]